GTTLKSKPASLNLLQKHLHNRQNCRYQQRSNKLPQRIRVKRPLIHIAQVRLKIKELFQTLHILRGGIFQGFLHCIFQVLCECEESLILLMCHDAMDAELWQDKESEDHCQARHQPTKYVWVST